MANGYLCDATEGHPGEDGPVPAAFLITKLDNGDTLALCQLDYTALCIAIAREAESQILDEPPVLNMSDDDEDDDEGDEAAIAALNGLGERLAPTEPVTVVATSTPGNAADHVTVVSRGTSHSRKVHEANKRAKASQATKPASAQ